jgi:sortase (surface protein transpeptidase)
LISERKKLGKKERKTERKIIVARFRSGTKNKQTNERKKDKQTNERTKKERNKQDTNTRFGRVFVPKTQLMVLFLFPNMKSAAVTLTMAAEASAT